MKKKAQKNAGRLLGRPVLAGLMLLGSLSALQGQPVVDDSGDMGLGGLLPDPSSILDLNSSAKGLLLPRLTTAQQNAIPAPALGLVIYNIDDGTPHIWSDASGTAQWDAVVTTGSGYGWLTDGNPGLTDGVNNFLGTTTGVPVRVITSNVERMRIEAGGHVGINQTAPSARLDVVGDGSDPAVEASNSAGAVAVQATVDGGSGLILGSVPAISGDNDDQTGVAGTSNTGIGVFGASNGNHGVNGLSLGAGVAGVHGRNDQAGGFGVLGTSFGPATGVFGSSQTGNAGAFSITNGASTADAVLIDNAGSGTGLEVNNNGAGDALEINVTGGGPGIDLNGGELDGNDRGNALGDGTANQQLTVRGTADAVIGNTLAGNPTVWDLVIQGDAVATGLMKLGGSMWLDGVSVPHQMSANNALLITTTSGDITINSAGGTTTVDDDLVVTGDLSVSGPFSLPGLTQGSVLFTGPGGTISEDNNNLFYDDALDRLGVGTSNTSARLTVLEPGTGTAVQATTAGAGNAGLFQITNAGSTSSAINVSTAGIGSGVTIQLTNAANGARGLDVSQSGVGPGVFATSAGGNAVWGITSSISAAGVIGDNTFGEAVVGRNRGGNGVGAVVGRNDSSGYGVRGFNTKDGVGVIGQAGISGGTGTAGRFENVNAANVSTAVAVASNGIGNGITVQLTNGSNGGRGIDVTQSGVGPGVFSTSAGGNAVWGITSSISAAGVIGDNTFGEAVVGRNRGGNGVGAVVGRNDSSGYGVRGFNTKNGYGVLGQAGISGGTGTAGRFENVNAANTSDALQVVTNSAGNAARFTGNVVVNGNLTVSGTVAKGGGSFMIDHPLDPENRILFHSFVESPDMKNINDGVVQLDAKGEAWVELPEWFQALNGDFRYQLTPIGAPGPGLYIAEEISNNRFRIAGGTPGMKVSWMVTGIRHDPWAEKNRIQVEVDKKSEERGTYLHPDAYGVESPAIELLGTGVQGEGKGIRSASTVQLSSEGTLPTIAPAAQSAAPQTTNQAQPVASQNAGTPAPTTSAREEIGTPTTVPPVASDRVERQSAPLPE